MPVRVGIMIAVKPGGQRGSACALVQISGHMDACLSVYLVVHFELGRGY